MIPNRWQIATTITSFGNAALLLILAGLLAAWLWRHNGSRTTLFWCAGVCLCAALTAALKLYFQACPMPDLQLRSPSGHTSFSTFVYGGLAFNIAAARPARRLLLVGAALAWAVAIGWSRVVVRAHSQSEVLFGFAIGAACLLLYALLSFREPRQRLPWLLLAGLTLLALFAAESFHGWTMEQQLRQWSRWLNQHIGLCRSAG